MVLCSDMVVLRLIGFCSMGVVKVLFIIMGIVFVCCMMFVMFVMLRVGFVGVLMMISLVFGCSDRVILLGW